MPKSAPNPGTPRPPLDLSRCCCADRNAVESSDAHPNLALPAAVAFVVPDSARAVRFVQAPDSPACVARTHVLNCVWLC